MILKHSIFNTPGRLNDSDPDAGSDADGDFSDPSFSISISGDTGGDWSFSVGGSSECVIL